MSHRKRTLRRLQTLVEEPLDEVDPYVRVEPTDDVVKDLHRGVKEPSDPDPPRSVVDVNRQHGDGVRGKEDVGEPFGRVDLGFFEERIVLVDLEAGGRSASRVLLLD
jgi:hypothetical protein